MPAKDALDVEKQLIFYGAYHSNPYNVAIHILCVPLLVWSALVFLAATSVPQAFPILTYSFNPCFALEFNWALLFASTYNIYYIVLEPVAGLLYVPQMTALLLSATAFARRSDAIKVAAYTHLFSCAMQFVGHGIAEKRAPALSDNVLGAAVLAPFFVHLEILFSLGYNKPLHRTVVKGSKVEIAMFRREKTQEQRVTKEALRKSDFIYGCDFLLSMRLASLN
ncbi:hypothetical protein FRB97_007157 [Tulasnella sp. 331]|nr:hypothetical protein FRB97_007157 [Tulasnella sp. 331]